MDSASLVAMFGVEGTPGDWDFFKHNATTIIGAADSAKLLAVAKKFTTAPTDHV